MSKVYLPSRHNLTRSNVCSYNIDAEDVSEMKAVLSKMSDQATHRRRRDMVEQDMEDYIEALEPSRLWYFFDLVQNWLEFENRDTEVWFRAMIERLGGPKMHGCFRDIHGNCDENWEPYENGLCLELSVA